MKITKIIYVLTGVVLLVSTFLTAPKGLSEVNIDIYNQALAQQEKIDQLGFSGFKLEDYNIRFYDGKNDYVVNDDTIKKEKPVLDTFVGTAYKIDDHYEIIVPTMEYFEKFASVINITGTVLSGEEDLGNNEYTLEDHIALLYHEGFHAYQMTHYEDNISKLATVKITEETIVMNIDNVESVKKDYQNELLVLKEALAEDNVDIIKEKLKIYIDMYHLRQSNLSDDVKVTEGYYETIEGTAFYVEVMMNDYTEYTKDLGVFYEGSHKYYQVGMVKCLLLDKIDSDWKGDYDFSITVEEVLEKVVGE